MPGGHRLRLRTPPHPPARRHSARAYRGHPATGLQGCIKTLFGLSAALDFVLMGLTKGWLPTHGKHIVWYRRGFHCVAKGHRAIGKQPISFIA